MIIIHKSEKHYLNTNELSKLVYINDDENEKKIQKNEFVISLE
jgi:hypothetical protein